MFVGPCGRDPFSTMYCSRMRKRGAENVIQAGCEDGGNEFGKKEVAEEPCSEAYLRRVTGEEDLETVRNLVLTVDTNETQVDHLGTLMPLLSELRLERGSTLASFRDLGSSLRNLRVLWLSACGVRHLDGVGALSSLEELYLAFNDVEDLTSIALHDRLEVLDLESNSVRDAEQAIQLGTCSRLWSLTLTANPVCRDRRYRRIIVEAVPQLASLDEEDVTEDDRRPPDAANEAGDPEPLVDTQQTPSKDLVYPPHHHRPPLSSPANQQDSEDASMRTHPEQFPLGPAGTGNRNLRELETSSTYSSHRNASRGVVVPTLSSDGGWSSEDVEQAAAAPQTCKFSSPRSYWWISQPPGELHGDSGGNPPEESTAPAERHGCSLELSLEWKCRGGDVHADGVEDKDEAGSEDAGGGVACWRRAEGRLEVSARHDIFSQDDTATAFVDEEEMVVKAIKNFRHLSIVAKTTNEGNNRSPRSRAAHGRAGSCSGTPRTPIRKECGDRWTAEGGNATDTGGKKRGESRSLQSPRGLEMGEISLTHVDGLADVGQSRGAGEVEASGNSDFGGGIDWLLKVLSLEDMGAVSTPRGTRATGEGANDAASALTHGSQVSIAGNPAFGLHRRRLQDQAMDTGDKSGAATSPSAPGKAETRQQVAPLAGAGVDEKLVARERTQECFGRQHLLTMGDPTNVRPNSTGEEEGRRVRGFASPPTRESENPPAAGGRAAAGDGPDEESSKTESPAAAESWPLSGSSHNASFRHRGTPSHHRQGDDTTLVASLCCRALLSPSTRAPQSLGRVRRRRPALTAGGAAAVGAKSFVETVEASRDGVCCSPTSVGAAKSVAAAVVANFHSRTRAGRSEPRGTRKPRGVLHSSAATLNPQKCTETVVGCEGGRENRLKPDLCGTGGATNSPYILIDNDDPDGGRNRWQHGEGIGRRLDGLSNRGRRGSDRTGGDLKPSEVPEWSPTTAPCENASGADSKIREDGRRCGGSDGDFGFRVGDAREQTVHGGGGGRDDGGDGIGGGSGGGSGGGAVQPFAPTEVVRVERRGVLGAGVSESDEKLVALLRERPKNVPQIRTRESFRNYFRGMDRERIGRLLREAYADRGSVECDAKVKKRLMLLERSLDTSFR